MHESTEHTEDTDRTLCEIDRTRYGESEPSERLVVAFRTYQGRPFLDLRLWFRDQTGTWRPTKKGTSIRRGELGRIREALAAAEHELESQATGRAAPGARSAPTAARAAGPRARPPAAPAQPSTPEQRSLGDAWAEEI